MCIFFPGEGVKGSLKLSKNSSKLVRTGFPYVGVPFYFGKVTFSYCRHCPGFLVLFCAIVMGIVLHLGPLSIPQRLVALSASLRSFSHMSRHIIRGWERAQHFEKFASLYILSDLFIAWLRFLKTN